MKTLIFLGTLLAASVSMACATSVCKGDRVLSERYGTGIVEMAFTNGQARVRFDNHGILTVQSGYLGKSVNCDGDICAGDRILTGQNAPGLAEEVFSNGITKAYLDRNGLEYYRTVTLGKGVKCDRGVCVGDTVLNSANGEIGKAREVFKNGYTLVYFENSGPRISQTGYLSSAGQ